MTAWRGRRPEDEEGIALVLTLLLIVMVAGLSLAMGAVILLQQQPTQEARKRVLTINAAQSGLQVALLNLRAANDGANNGDITKIPCTSTTAATFSTVSPVAEEKMDGAAYTGIVTSASDTANPGYTVSVAYFRVNPAGMTPGQLKAIVMPCRAAGGVGSVPAFAYLQSYGSGTRVPGNTANQGNRTQVATYQFTTTNINVVGGRLRSYGTQQCLDAGDAPVSPGRLLTLQPCLALGTARQTWQYRRDLSLFYGGDTTLNLCIQAPSGTDNRPVLKTCTTSGASSGTGSTYPYAAGQQVQEWGFNDNGHFASAANDGNVGGACLQPAGAGGSTAAASGAALVYVGCDGNTEGPAAFDPDPQVGAGKAGGGITGVPGATKQFVNYAQFGRCLDITGGSVAATFLIAYPCKQAPDSNKLRFNQVWTYAPGADGYGPFSVINTEGDQLRYCLTAPAAGSFPTVTACPTTVADAQQWHATGKATTYAGSYTLVSKSSGQCLGLAPYSEGQAFGATKITTSPCDGSSVQKWNAPPDAVTNPLSNILEQNGS